MMVRRFSAMVFVTATWAQAAEPLVTASVAYREVDQLYAAEGVVEAVKQSTVAAQISGRIVDIRFDVGDRVKKGEVIVRIDEREVSDALASTQAQIAQAQATLANAKAQYGRTQQLFSQKFVSQAALDRAQADYRAARAQLEAAVAVASQAATVKSFATVTAPYSGVVAARHVELGEMVAPGKPLMTGFDPGDMRVAAAVPQFKLAEIRNSAAASIEFPALNQWVTAGTMTALPSADPKTHTTTVRLALLSYVSGTYPGMFARVHFVVGRARKLVIPASAVVRRTEITGVYVAGVDGAVQFRQVRLGESAGEAGVEVLAGLKPGERVALDPVKAAIAMKAAQQRQ